MISIINYYNYVLANAEVAVGQAVTNHRICNCSVTLCMSFNETVPVTNILAVYSLLVAMWTKRKGPDEDAFKYGDHDRVKFLEQRCYLHETQTAPSVGKLFSRRTWKFLWDASRETATRIRNENRNDAWRNRCHPFLSPIVRFTTEIPSLTYGISTNIKRLRFHRQSRLQINALPVSGVILKSKRNILGLS